jgi:hypothetical protein
MDTSKVLIATKTVCRLATRQEPGYTLPEEELQRLRERGEPPKPQSVKKCSHKDNRTIDSYGRWDVVVCDMCLNVFLIKEDKPFEQRDPAAARKPLTNCTPLDPRRARKYLVQHIQ